jgi:hypothetical protein
VARRGKLFQSGHNLRSKIRGQWQQIRQHRCGLSTSLCDQCRRRSPGRLRVKNCLIRHAMSGMQDP